MLMRVKIKAVHQEKLKGAWCCEPVKSRVYSMISMKKQLPGCLRAKVGHQGQTGAARTQPWWSIQLTSFTGVSSVSISFSCCWKALRVPIACWAF